MLNTYICHQLPPTCFGVCYTIFMGTIALLAHELQGPAEMSDDFAKQL